VESGRSWSKAGSSGDFLLVGAMFCSDEVASIFSEAFRLSNRQPVACPVAGPVGMILEVGYCGGRVFGLELGGEARPVSSWGASGTGPVRPCSCPTRGRKSQRSKVTAGGLYPSLLSPRVSWRGRLLNRSGRGAAPLFPVGSIPHQEGVTGPAVSPRGSGPSSLSAHTWVETVARGGMSRLPGRSPDPPGEGADYGLFPTRHGPHFHPSRLVGPVRLPPLWMHWLQGCRYRGLPCGGSARPWLGSL
jgi:hypothetical protein